MENRDTIFPIFVQGDKRRDGIFSVCHLEGKDWESVTMAKKRQCVAPYKLAAVMYKKRQCYHVKLAAVMYN